MILSFNLAIHSIFTYCIILSIYLYLNIVSLFLRYYIYIINILIIYAISVLLIKLQLQPSPITLICMNLYKKYNNKINVEKMKI